MNSSRPDGRFPLRPVTAILAIVVSCATTTAWGQVAPEPESPYPQLKAVEPERQRVHEMITLHGEGFGSYRPGVSRVIFTRLSPDFEPPRIFEAGTPYVWRDGVIQVQVPVGDIVGGGVEPIPKGVLAVQVVVQNRRSNAVKLQVIAVPDDVHLAFRQLTRIEADRDVSKVLGDPNLNLARTKDADIGDVNGDGYPDLVDNNSNNILNGTHGVLRLNARNGGFRAIALEPVDENDVGFFATVIPPGGTYIRDATTYDSDLVDLTNDLRPELVQALANSGGSRVRVLRNQGGIGQLARFFRDDTNAWLPGAVFTGRPDDVAHTDVNHDGFVDVAIALRNSPAAEVFLNRGGETFALPIEVEIDPPASAHDVFFLDANDDGFQDVVLVNESSIGTSQLFFHNGSTLSPVFLPGPELPGGSDLAGAAADFNADGLTDLAIVGFQFSPSFQATTVVYLNDRDDPGTFKRTQLPSAGSGIFYDLELGDIDLDGDVDMVAAAIITDPDETIAVWLNDGDGGFVEATAGGAGDLLPGIAPYQRLSADLIDLDRDGDLDLYVTGADGQDVGPGSGFGRVPNQLYENLILRSAIDPAENP